MYMIAQRIQELLIISANNNEVVTSKLHHQIPNCQLVWKVDLIGISILEYCQLLWVFDLTYHQTSSLHMSSATTQLFISQLAAALHQKKKTTNLQFLHFIFTCWQQQYELWSSSSKGTVIKIKIKIKKGKNSITLYHTIYS